MEQELAYYFHLGSNKINVITIDMCVWLKKIILTSQKNNFS